MKLAQAHSINTNLLFKWHWHYRASLFPTADAGGEHANLAALSAVAALLRQ